MKKSFLFVIAAIILCASIAFVGCENASLQKGENAEEYALNFGTVYALAEEAGYTGTLEDLVALFKGDNAYQLAVAAGYTGTQEEWLTSLAGVAGKDGVTPRIGENKHWFLGDVDTGVVAEGKDGKSGADGVGIEKIEKTGSEGLVDIYTITMTNGATSTFTVTNGKDGKDSETVSDPNAPTPDEYFRFKLLENDTYEISARYVDMPVRTVIPSEYKGKPVTSIAENGFRDRLSIDEIVIPNSVTMIKSYAFKACTGLTSIPIPASVTYIGDHTFDCESAFTSIEYSGDLKSWCSISGLDGIMRYGAEDKSLFIDGVKIEGSLSIPEGMKVIKPYAFFECRGITSVSIPSTIETVDIDAFYECTGIKKITGHALAGRVAQSCHAPAFNMEITSGSVFDSCGGGVRDIYLYSGITSLGKDVFNGKGVTNITFGENSQLTSIGERAFRFCDNLTTITLPSGVKSIGNNAFSDCKALASISFPDGIETIGEEAFENCGALSPSITIPASIQSIGYRAFYLCEKITAVYFEGTISQWCQTPGVDNLTFMSSSPKMYLYINGDKIDGSITIPEGVTNIVDGAFSEVPHLTSIHIPASVKSIGYNAFSNFALTSITFAENSQLTTIGEYAFSITSISSITLPAGITAIPRYAFIYCEKLETVSFEENSKLTSIASYAFRGCKKLSDLTIPSGVTTIGANAFYECTLIKKITTPIFAIEYLPNKIGLETVVITNDTEIPASTFSGFTALTSVTIPVSVTSIGRGAFTSCASLTEIRFQGTEEQWNTIEKAEDWDRKAGDYTVIFAE